ncbi:MAG: C39 family peptidase [Verrucomicrobiota bacterium]
MAPAGPKFVSLDALTDPATLWETTPATAETQLGKAHLKWLSTSKDRANIKRQPYSNVKQELKIAGGKVDVEEVTIEFTDSKLARIAFSLWNRGDSTGSFDAKSFKAKVTEIAATLNDVFGAKGVEMGPNRTGAAKFERTQWLTPKLSAQLEYSGAKVDGEFKAEFIRLRVGPPVKQAAVGEVTAGGTKTGIGRTDLVKNVKHEDNGDTWISTVPMVDQGMKGYCAVASCQRVFNYLGMNVDEHEMAQVAESSSGGGTSSKKLSEALDTLEGRLKIRFKKLYDLWTNKAFSAMVSDYNRIARKRSAKPLDWTTTQLQEMNPADLKAARSKGPDYTKFQRMVKDNVDKGVPILWSLTLGMYPENGKDAMQSGGGHMRLIIGYNVKDAANPVLIFSDSWGAGHEKKTMDMASAFAATNGLIVLEPQQK